MFGWFNEDLRLALEAGEPFSVRGERLGQDLDGHLPLQPWVAGAVDLAHAAGAKRAEDFEGAEAVASGQRHANVRRII